MGKRLQMPCVKNNSEEILLIFKVKYFLKDLFLKKKKKVFIKNQGLIFNFFRRIL